MENPFKKILASLSGLGNIFKKGETSVIGVDIGPSSIKIVQLKKKGGKAALETYGALALGPYAGIEVGRATRLPAEKIAEALLDVIREANITSKSGGLSIPMSSSLLSIIQVPAVSQKELTQLIPLEARKYIPIPISEVALDWWVIPKEDSGMTDFAPVAGASDANQVKEKINVLLVVIHNDAITQVQEIIRLANLNASFFEIEIFSTIRAVLDHEPEPVMILDMGSGSTKLYIVDKGVLRTSHIITRGSQDLTIALSKALSISVEEAEVVKRQKGLLVGTENAEAAGVMTSTISFMFTEANRVLLNYQKKYNKNVSKIVLTGG